VGNLLTDYSGIVIDTIISQVNSLAANADDIAREKIILTLHDLVYALETPNDTMQLITFYVSPKRSIVLKIKKRQ
jgi:hypothetical protein